MSYKEKPILKLYKYQNGSFVLQAQIDDYMEASWEDNLYQAGRFTITINFNIPNASLFERKLFIQFGNSTKFGEITIIQDSIGEDGKGSQLRVISGYDARYILKRRVIKNMNSNGLWQMTDKGELCLRNLIEDQCGSNAESKRQLPIINTIPASQDAIGKEYTVSESFTNLYEVCKTIATQSEIGWRIDFNGQDLILICFPGTDRSDNVRFDTNFESLRDGQFSDSSESYSNTIYVGGKGQNDNRDIYEGEDLIDGESPASLDRFESWDNQSSLTTEEEYEAEALSMLTQYGQTITMSGNGLAKCPYEYEKEYFVGDTIVLAFSGKSAKVQILSVTEHWTWASYEIQFQFGKPINNLSDQLQLMLRQIQRASNKQSAVDSVRWYELPDEDEMPKADVTYDTLGFTGAVPNNGTFKLYLDDEKTGSKYYDIYVKNLTGNKLTLTTEKTIEGQPAQDLILNIGTYVANIYVDENGNIILNSSTPAQTVEEGNNQPVTSDAVYQAISEISVEANPSETPTENLTSLEVGGTIYSVGGGSGIKHIFQQDRLYFSYSSQTVNTSNVSLQAGTYLMFMSFDYDYSNNYSGTAQLTINVSNGDNSLSYSSASITKDYNGSYHKLTNVTPMIVKVSSTTNHRPSIQMSWGQTTPPYYWRFYRHYIKVA